MEDEFISREEAQGRLDALDSLARKISRETRDDIRRSRFEHGFIDDGSYRIFAMNVSLYLNLIKGDEIKYRAGAVLRHHRFEQRRYDHYLGLPRSVAVELDVPLIYGCFVRGVVGHGGKLFANRSDVQLFSANDLQLKVSENSCLSYEMLQCVERNNFFDGKDNHLYPLGVDSGKGVARRLEVRSLSPITFIGRNK